MALSVVHGFLWLPLAAMRRMQFQYKQGLLGLLLHKIAVIVACSHHDYPMGLKRQYRVQARIAHQTLAA